MQEIYSQIILDHSRNQANKHDLENPDIKEDGHNPSCGDEIVLQLKLDGDKIVDAAFTGDGCAISQAAEELEDAVAFKNIQNMPQRVNCALLSWNTLRDVIDEKK